MTISPQPKRRCDIRPGERGGPGPCEPRRARAVSLLLVIHSSTVFGIGRHQPTKHTGGTALSSNVVSCNITALSDVASFCSMDRVEWPLSIATPCHYRLSPRHCCCDAAFHHFTPPFTAALLLRDVAFHRLSPRHCCWATLPSTTLHRGTAAARRCISPPFTAALPLQSQGHRGRVPVGLFLRGARVPRVRPNLTDTPSPSLLTHLLKGEGGTARITEFSSTAARFGSERLVSVKSQVRPQGWAVSFFSNATGKGRLSFSLHQRPCFSETATCFFLLDNSAFLLYTSAFSSLSETAAFFLRPVRPSARSRRCTRTTWRTCCARTSS